MITVKDNENTIIINKSKFITHLYRVNTKIEAETLIKTTKKEHYNASHNCFAYIIMDKTLQKKCSDDGEPQKTAGSPMLDVLEKNNLCNILAITTRYFGGIKLGAGGLTRAYSKSVRCCLETSVLIEIKEMSNYIFKTDYSLSNKIDKLLNKDYLMKSKTYEQEVEYSYLLEAAQEKMFLNDIKELSLGKVLPTFFKKEDYEVVIKKTC